jgi:hypothetical protein
MPALDTKFKTVADKVADLSCKNVGTVGHGEIGRDRIGASAGRADLIDHGFGFVGIASVMDDDAGAGGSECQGCGATHSAGRAGNKCGFIGEGIHRCVSYPR